MTCLLYYEYIMQEDCKVGVDLSVFMISVVTTLFSEQTEMHWAK